MNGRLTIPAFVGGNPRASDGALTVGAKAARVREISLFDNAGWRADTEEP